MDIDRRIISDIKAIRFRLFEAGTRLWRNRLKIIKWVLIIFALFILYEAYKIIIHRKIVKPPAIINKTIYIKKSGNYTVGLYLNIGKSYFLRRDIIADTFFNKKRKKIIYLPSLGAALNSYTGKININQETLYKFHSIYRYRHLLFALKMVNLEKNSNPFFLFYLNFDKPHKLERILYTPINIPKADIVRTYTILANIQNNKNIKPGIKINKFIYFYPRFNISGTVHSIKAAFTYKHEGKMFLSKRVNLYSRDPINIYRVLKNKKNRGNNLKLIKINILYKVSKNRKGNVNFTSLELIEPNILSLEEEVFKNFIFKTYFKNFMQKNIVFKNELKKMIYKGGKNNIPAETVKKKFVRNTINRIFFIDYNTKIKYVSNIHSKIVRSFYRFVYKKYMRKESFAGNIAGLFNHKKAFYKNLLIPIKSSSVKTVQNNKTIYFTINFKNLKLYKYFMRNESILNRIVKGGGESPNKLTLRGSNDDYWRGKYYYLKYPSMGRIKVFSFITSSRKAKIAASYFYFNSIPEAYPKFLMYNNKTVGHYSDILRIINKYNNSNPYKFFKGPELNYLMKTKLLHIENLDFLTNGFLLFRQFINDKQEFNKIFKNGGGYVYKKVYLKKGTYYVNFLNSRLFKTKMITLTSNETK